MQTALKVEALEPFTIEHFVAWTRDLVLDNGEFWVIEDYQVEFFGDALARFGRPSEDWDVVPEGNGKSTGLGGFCLYGAEFSNEGWIPVAASSRDQAKIMYRQMKGFVRRTPRLEKVFRCYDGYRRITHIPSDSQIEIFAADDRTGDGIIPGPFAVIDELHRHRSMDLYQTWRGKLNKRNAHLIVISTAGEPGGEFEEARERMRQTATEIERRPGFVRAVSEDFVLHDWAVAEDGDPDDLEQVKAANPLSTITVETLRKKLASPTMTPQHWRRFTCNLPTRSEMAAIQEAEWFAAATTDEIPLGEPVWVGLDVAWKWDTTAAVPLWWRDDHYRLFGAASILEPPRDGTSLDPDKVEAALVAINARNPIHTLVMDMHRAEQLAAWAETEFNCTVVDRQQTNKFAVDDYVKFMEALREGWLKHSGDAGFTRHALNAIARILPQGDARFERPHQSRNAGEQDRRVIDALSAASMVHATAAAGSNDFFIF